MCSTSSKAPDACATEKESMLEGNQEDMGDRAGGRKSKCKSGSKPTKTESRLSKGAPGEERGTADAEDGTADREKNAKNRHKKVGGGAALAVSNDELENGERNDGERKRDKSRGSRKSAGSGAAGEPMDVEEEPEKRSKSKKRKREVEEIDEDEEDHELLEDDADEDGGGWDSCVTNYTAEIGRLQSVYKQFKVIVKAISLTCAMTMIRIMCVLRCVSDDDYDHVCVSLCVRVFFWSVSTCVA